MRKTLAFARLRIIEINHNHKKRKDGLEIWAVGRTGNTSKQQKMAAFSKEFQSEDDVEAVLTTFSCNDYCANASKAIEKIATGQKDYHKNTPCVL